MKKSFDGRWYIVSFALLLVPIAAIYYLCAGNQTHVLTWLIKSAWGLSGVGGILCALIGGGGLNRRPIDGMGSLALILHLGSMGLWILAAF